MNGYGVTNEVEQAAEVGPCPPPEADEPKPEQAEAPKAWAVAYGNVGLINIVAESQEALVEWVQETYGSCDLHPVDVMSNTPGGEVTTIWIYSHLIEAVLNQHKPRMLSVPGMPPGMPPGLEALLKSAIEGGDEGEETEVVVVEPGPGPEMPAEAVDQYQAEVEPDKGND